MKSFLKRVFLMKNCFEEKLMNLACAYACFTECNRSTENVIDAETRKKSSKKIIESLFGCVCSTFAHAH